MIVTDTQGGEVTFPGTIKEDGTPAVLALRLKIENRQISEVETPVQRSERSAQGFEKIGWAWTETIPAAERISREDLIKTANMYFSGMQKNDGKGVYPFADDCNRIEQFQSGLLHFVTRIRDRRFVVVDPERGLVFSFVFFDHSGGHTRTFQTPDGRTVTAGPAQLWTWQLAELFKIERGKIRQIEAIMERAPYGINSGWSNWEDGLSDRAR
jgi:hypothetical protein